MQACPNAGAPLDNWRRRDDLRGRLRRRRDSPRGDVELRPDEIDAGAAAVRGAYVRAMSRSNVPATELEVAALAAHLKRPIELIRGPRAREEARATGGERRRLRDVRRRARKTRSRGIHPVLGVGRGGADGTPRGDFVLLVPREGMGRRTGDEPETRARGRGRGRRRGRRRGRASGPARGRGPARSRRVDRPRRSAFPPGSRQGCVARAWAKSATAAFPARDVRRRGDDGVRRGRQ